LQLIRNAGLHPVGVYLGWRGENTTVPVVRQFTFFSRKAAAERLASNFDCYDAIVAVSQAGFPVEKIENKLPPCDRQKNGLMPGEG
jgi:hypothetical protein